MPRKKKQNAQKTIGELRRRLAKLGNPWEVDPRFSDDDPLPDPQRGGQREEEIPEEDRLVPLAADSDLRALIAAQPPANPFLRVRWVETGMLNQDEIGGLALESDETEWGVA